LFSLQPFIPAVLLEPQTINEDVDDANNAQSSLSYGSVDAPNASIQGNELQTPAEILQP
jgi:hypothetical protein